MREIIKSKIEVLLRYHRALLTDVKLNTVKDIITMLIYFGQYLSYYCAVDCFYSDGKGNPNRLNTGADAISKKLDVDDKARSLIRTIIELRHDLIHKGDKGTFNKLLSTCNSIHRFTFTDNFLLNDETFCYCIDLIKSIDVRDAVNHMMNYDFSESVKKAVVSVSKSKTGSGSFPTARGFDLF